MAVIRATPASLPPQHSSPLRLPKGNGLSCGNGGNRAVLLLPVILSYSPSFDRWFVKQTFISRRKRWAHFGTLIYTFARHTVAAQTAESTHPHMLNIHPAAPSAFMIHSMFTEHINSQSPAYSPHIPPCFSLLCANTCSFFITSHLRKYMLGIQLH